MMLPIDAQHQHIGQRHDQIHLALAAHQREQPDAGQGADDAAAPASRPPW